MTNVSRFDRNAPNHSTMVWLQSPQPLLFTGRNTARIATTVAVVLGVGCSLALSRYAGAGDPASSLPLAGEAAERFLRTARVVQLKSFKTRGVTLPRKATLSDDQRTLNAVFKDIDTYNLKATLAGGEVVFHFRDSYRHEIAAYELDKLLGLGIVPPCVQRRIRGSDGALCLWVEDTMTEWERLGQGDLPPPDAEDWDRQMMTIRMFLQLIDDIDFRNVSNLLVDRDFKIYKIDSSRAFFSTPELRNAAELTRFSRSAIEALRSLKDDDLYEALKEWLVNDQIKGLLARRDRIIQLADARVAALGEQQVLYP